jgi:glycosyltransferase involved in cell wall biosynthesis
MSTILLVGTFPPPYGGASVFLQREQHYLENEGFDVTILDTLPGPEKQAHHILGHWRRAFSFGRDRRFDVVHVHAHSAKFKFVMATLAVMTGARLVLSYHSYRTSLRGVRWMANQFALAFADEVWVNNEETKKGLEKDFRVRPGRVVLVQHFLPPLAAEYALTAPDENFVAFSRRYRPLLMTSAWKLMQVGGKDLYGGDLCLRLIAELCPIYPNAGLVFFIGRNDFPERLTHLRDMASGLGIAERVLFLVGDHRTLPYLKEVDAYLRCTRSDTLGASILESLLTGIPAVASDVCPRPVGTIVFHAEDLKDLVVKTQTALDTKKVPVQQDSRRLISETILVTRMQHLATRGAIV